jgi:hypothetical protein
VCIIYIYIHIHITYYNITYHNMVKGGQHHPWEMKQVVSFLCFFCFLPRKFVFLLAKNKMRTGSKARSCRSPKQKTFTSFLFFSCGWWLSGQYSCYRRIMEGTLDLDAMSADEIRKSRKVVTPPPPPPPPPPPQRLLKTHPSPSACLTCTHSFSRRPGRSRKNYSSNSKRIGETPLLVLFLFLLLPPPSPPPSLPSLPPRVCRF